MNELIEFRNNKDEFFARDHHSPLTDTQKSNFHGLDYFPEVESLRLKVKVDKFDEKEEISMQTSTGDFQSFQRYGRFRFSVDGQDAELTVYLNEHGYFLPFVDSMAGQETYPAGRYLDPEPQQDGSFIIDFNLAYNPYCAYNERWSCPLTPSENRVQLPLRAGEKIFNDSI
jgi:uncharacterized protein (DUF1684 family)